MSVEEAEAKTQAEQQSLVTMFMHRLDVDEEVAQLLVEEGFSTLEEVAYVPEDEFLAIEAFDQDTVSELRNRAQAALLSQAISQDGGVPTKDLLTMEGMDDALAYTLAKRGVCTMDDLAEQSIDELIDLEGMSEERAAQLIMTARAPWFADNKAE